MSVTPLLKPTARNVHLNSGKWTRLPFIANFNISENFPFYRSVDRRTGEEELDQAKPFLAENEDKIDVLSLKEFVLDVSDEVNGLVRVLKKLFGPEFSNLS